jgi:hypothetical protein
MSTMDNFSTFTTSASATRPVRAGDSKAPNSCSALLITETAGSAARVKFYRSALDKPGACVAADGAAGNSTVGNHIFKVTYVTAQGETELGTASNTLNSAGSKIMTLTGIPTLSGAGSELVTGRNVYMTEAGGSTYYKIDSAAVTTPTIADNTTTTLSVNISDATLAGYAAAPTANTSGVLNADIRLAASQTFYMAFPNGAVSAYLARCEITTGAATSYLYGK